MYFNPNFSKLVFKFLICLEIVYILFTDIRDVLIHNALHLYSWKNIFKKSKNKT